MKYTLYSQGVTRNGYRQPYQARYMFNDARSYTERITFEMNGDSSCSLAGFEDGTKVMEKMKTFYNKWVDAPDF